MTCFLSFFPSLDRTAAHKDVCFTRIEEGWICSEPQNRVVTYSECCCHFGRGWGPECNSCPPRNSGELLKIYQTSLGLNPFIELTRILSVLPSNVQPSVWDASRDGVRRGTGFAGSFSQLQPG